MFGELATGLFAQPTNEGRLRWRSAADVPRLRTDRSKLREIVLLLLGLVMMTRSLEEILNPRLRDR